MLQGDYGFEDVFLIVLTIVGPRGVQGKLPVKLNDEEIEKLHRSANALKAVIAEIEL